MTNLKELRKLIKLCRDNGIKQIKTADLEITIDNGALYPKPKVKVKEVAKEENSDSRPLTDDEILFWSVPQDQGAS